MILTLKSTLTLKFKFKFKLICTLKAPRGFQGRVNFIRRFMCPIKVYDSITNRVRNCKLRHGELCYLHGRHYIIKIQAAWRMYKCRKTVNLFKNIGDPWCLVLKYINERNNIGKLYASHIAVYQRREEIHRKQASKLLNISKLYANQWQAQVQNMYHIEAEDTKFLFVQVERLRGIEIDLIYKAQDSMNYFGRLFKIHTGKFPI